jgi:integrase
MTGAVRKRTDASGQTRWIADVTINGKRRQASGWTKAEAIRKKKELQALLIAAPLSAGDQTFQLAEARMLSLKVRWAGLAYERTASIYSQAAVDFFGPHMPLGAISATAVEEWRSALRAQGNRPATINRKVSALKAMFSDAHLHGRITTRPAMPKQLRAGGDKDRVMSDRERDQFCEHFQAIEEPAAALVLVFLLESCARWGEVERLRWSDVDFQRSRVTFWKTKNRHPRTVPLTARAMDAVKAAGVPVPSARVFPYSYDRYRRLFDRAKEHMGLAHDPSLTIHTTRHTCASKLASRGISLVQLMTFGGWSSLAAVKRYLHLSTDALSACVEALEAG